LNQDVNRRISQRRKLMLINFPRKLNLHGETPSIKDNCLMAQ
jgi:hypothetical protein